MAKNADKPPDEAPGLFKASGISILQEIGGEIQAELDEEKAAKAGKKQELKTVGRAFRNSLKKLMDKLAEAEPHYIRCIKPNSPKKPNLFEAPMVNEQLIYSGVMEVVRIRQLGYAARVPFHDFCDRYPTILSRQERKAFFDAKPTKGERELAALLMEKIKPYFTEGMNLVPGCKPIDDVGMKIGKTKVFAKWLNNCVGGPSGRRQPRIRRGPTITYPCRHRFQRFLHCSRPSIAVPWPDSERLTGRQGQIRDDKGKSPEGKS